jgi:hypothetical protein
MIAADQLCTYATPLPIITTISSLNYAVKCSKSGPKIKRGEGGRVGTLVVSRFGPYRKI